ncbi:MAG TPA: hypothetical protein VF506_10935 [Streptosporangiaceae bacterium]
MKIAMYVKISGGRGDGTEWPDPHVPFEVDDAEGRHLCQARLAYPVPGDEPAETPDVQAAAGAEVRNAAKPIVNSPKAAWVDHAVSLGFDRDEAAAMSKADLIAAVKG